MGSPFPPGEEDRIDALNRLQVLDSAPEECFDGITRLAAQSLQVPIAVISCVDRNRQWFKSRVGIDESEIPRDQAFCAQTILSDRPFMVENAANDPAFAGTRLVGGEAGVRFYAGVPLHSAPGLRIGTLCVMDRKARRALTSDEVALLQNLAGLVEELLKMRLAAQRLSEMGSALRAAERSYRSLVENCPTGIYRISLEGEILLANPAVLTIFGFDSLAELSAANSEGKVLAPHGALMNGLLEGDCAICDDEATWRTPAGREVRIRQSARIFRDENGSPLYYEGTVQDVTEQYLASQTVCEQEQRWELALRANNDGIFERNWETQQSWYSDRYAEILGYAPGELSSDWEARIHPDDADRVKALMAAHLRGETERYEAEYRMRCKEGSYKWTLSRGQAYLASNGAFRRMIGSLTDISPRKLDEERMRAAEERYRQLFQYNPLPVIVYDTETLRILAVNAAAERVFEYSRDELLQLGLTALLPEPLRSRALEIVRSLQTFPYRSSRYENLTKHGRGILVEVTIHPIEFDRRPAHIAIITDVTEITRAQQQLRAALKQAEEASRSKSRFLAMMSHEIRTPMNGVIGMTDLLLKTQLGNEQRDYVETIRSSGEVLLHIINDVLDLSKIESGRLEFEKVEVDLRHVLEEAVRLTAPAARSKQLTIRVDVAPEVPASVTSDPGRLCQVLLNLLSNAIKFTQKGEIALRLSVDGITSDTVRLRFIVRDSGIGIDSEKVQSLFQPFTQADASTTRRFGGTGLGLAISKSLVELMGGQIGCESAPGQGSTFWFVLPMSRVLSESKREPVQRATSDQSRRSTRASMRLLVAEDNAVNQKLVVHLLRRLGHTADVVENGRLAVEAYRAFPYKLILMDSQMPEMDGFEATRLIRQLETGQQRTVIISVTANALEGDRDRSLAAGMDDYIAKPLNAGLFEEKMNHWIDVLTAGKDAPLTASLVAS